jgi:hypothetical protein
MVLGSKRPIVETVLFPCHPSLIESQRAEIGPHLLEADPGDCTFSLSPEVNRGLNEQRLILRSRRSMVEAVLAIHLDLYKDLQ